MCGRYACVYLSMHVYVCGVCTSVCICVVRVHVCVHGTCVWCVGISLEYVSIHWYTSSTSSCKLERESVVTKHPERLPQKKKKKTIILPLADLGQTVSDSCVTWSRVLSDNRQLHTAEGHMPLRLRARNSGLNLSRGRKVQMSERVTLEVRLQEPRATGSWGDLRTGIFL